MRWKRAVIYAVVVGMAAIDSQAATILSEVFYDAVGSDDGQVFVEISGAPGTSLEGLVIEGINGANGAAGPTIVLSGTIGSSGLFVVADQMSDGTTFVPLADMLANFDLQNGPDSVVLRRGDIILDALGYGVFASGEIFAGEGEAAPDPEPGSSLARIFADQDSDDNLTDFRVLTVPTPGVADFTPVPEPGAVLMIGLGLSGLSFAGRKRSVESGLVSSDQRRQVGEDRSTLPTLETPIKRSRAWQRSWIGITSARVERLALERPSFWTPMKS